MSHSQLPSKIGTEYLLSESLYNTVYEEYLNWPMISIVTPSFNQGKYIETTIRSILLQNYPNLEYIIIDGGSTDETVDIIKRYEDQLAYWVSEPDSGQSEAINKGIAKATGQIFNWINSDDWLAPDALKSIAIAFSKPETKLVCSPTWLLNINGERTFHGATDINLPIYDTLNSRGLNQMGMYWDMARIRALAGVNPSFRYSMDLDLWKRYILTYGLKNIAQIDFVNAYFRLHDESKTGSSFEQNFEWFDLENNAAMWNYASIAGSNYLNGIRMLFPDTESRVFSETISEQFDTELLKGWLTSLFFDFGKRAFYREEFKISHYIFKCIEEKMVPVKDLRDFKSFRRWSAIKRWF